MRIEHIGDSRTVTTRLIRCFRIANSRGRSFLFYTTFLTLSKDLFNAPTYDQAVERRDQLVKDWQTEFPKVVKKLENSFDELMVIYQLPEELRKRLRTNNTIERVNQEIRRRDRVIRIFPNALSVLRLMGALLIEQNEKWAAGPRYLNMTVYHGIEKDDNSEEAGMLKLVK